MDTPARKATITIDITEGADPEELYYAVSTEGLVGGETTLLEVLDALVQGMKAGV